MAGVVLVSACSTVLGFKEAKVVDAAPDPDAPVDAPIGTAIDAMIDAPIDAPIDSPMATCVPANCPFGCDTTTDACKNGKLWVFRTAAGFVGNNFGGTDNPINVRGGSTSRCQESAVVFPSLVCDANHMLAILHVSATDSIPLMAGKYGIPTTAPVHRPADDVLVANNWNDLTDPNKALRAAVMPPPATDADGQIWTGANTASHCTNWTSASHAISGAIGFANRSNSTWLDGDTLECDNGAGLLCICWDAP